MDGLRQKLEKQGLTNVTYMVVNHQGAMSQLLHSQLQQKVSEHVVLYQQAPGQPDVWQALAGEKDDFLIYDRCGRLTYHIALPYSILTTPHVEEAIKGTYCKNVCGSCEYENSEQQLVCYQNVTEEPEHAHGHADGHGHGHDHHHGHGHGHDHHHGHGHGHGHHHGRGHGHHHGHGHGHHHGHNHTCSHCPVRDHEASHEAGGRGHDASGHQHHSHGQGHAHQDLAQQAVGNLDLLQVGQQAVGDLGLLQVRRQRAPEPPQQP